jgi:hypothetical protein
VTTLSCALLLCLANAAGDAGPAYFHPDDVAAKSSLFAVSSEKMSSRFDAVQREMDRASVALEALDRNATLLGGRAPEPFRTWAQDTRKQANGEFLTIQRFVDTLTTDFQKTFEAALDRAIAAMPPDSRPSPCRKIGVAGFTGPGASVGHCTGEDRNAALANVLDADPALARDVHAMLALEWPAFHVASAPQVPVAVTGTARVIDLDSVVGRLVKEKVDALGAAHDDALEPVRADLESDQENTRAKAVAQGQALRAHYEAQMAGVGALLLDSLAKSLERGAKKGWPSEIAVCGNPRMLGGCVGEDVTEQILPLLADDARLRKALESAPSP